VARQSRESEQQHSLACATRQFKPEFRLLKA
jgi:hypothetical protein